MARVCVDWFPNESNPDKAGFYMDDVLKANLDVLILNALDDWDFTCLISGGGGVRVGKSLLAMQIACYWCYEMLKVHKRKTIFALNDNFAFRGSELIPKGHHLGKNFPSSPLIFDEAGADLEGRKSLKRTTQNVLDYFREAGQYNLFNILVIPEFFDLPKGIALSRSTFLIDVYYNPDSSGKFERGFFNFYSKPQKKKLYIFGKKELNYQAAKYDFHGRFYKFYPLNESEYRGMKQEALLSRQDNEDNPNKYKQQRNALMAWLVDKGCFQKDIADYLKQCKCPLTQQTISHAITEHKKHTFNSISVSKEGIDDGGVAI